ncbi:uncharacterized protein ARMOST_18987 [Armillaria ostoyae]|uniref:F-box domain-containing protein n=1 Tax=Armillaria ostoyae TaxID=47428 RepID=A0A284S3C5_ARMOS|nr:uncharacterized protein ARMOST_18987 [Armillaria ostoyae]
MTISGLLRHSPYVLPLTTLSHVFKVLTTTIVTLRLRIFRPDIPATSILPSVVFRSQFHPFVVAISQSDIPAIEDQIAAPISGLFVEILTCIFHICLLEDGPSFQHLDVNDHKSGPWKLGQVCSSWRHIANNTPIMWTHLSLIGYRVVRDPVSRFKVALERSSCFALNLELSPSDKYPLDVQREIYQVAIAHSWRWEHLKITPRSLILPFLSEIRRHPLDKFSHLVVQCYHLWTPLNIDAFQYAPALRIVELHTNYADAVFELPWNHIVEFFDFRSWGDAESINRVLDIIQRSPNIQTLHVPMICCSPSTAVSLPVPLVRSSLRDLTVCEGPILRSLVVPQLQKICLAPGEDTTDYCPDDALPALLNLIHRSSSRTSFSLTYFSTFSIVPRASKRS